MGRKKVDIKFLENEKTRKVTFQTRVGGIVKKLYDLNQLCKIKASLVLTDLEGNLITYSNTSELQLVLSDDYNDLRNFSVSAF